MKKISIPKSIATKYAGRTGVIYKGKVVAGGNDTFVALKNAQKKYPKIKRSDVSVMSLPPKSGVWVL